MPMRHVAKCDQCGKEEALIATTAFISQTRGGFSSGQGLAHTFAIPARWQGIGGATLCSWRCVAVWAANKGDHDQRTSATNEQRGE